MQLYLVQHGRAASKEEDPDRPLTEEGRREVEAVLLLMMRFGAITATRILHSGKRRAEETARIIADKLKAEMVVGEDLGPTDDPTPWRERLIEMDRDLVLVGHLPHLSWLAALLLAGDRDADLVEFTNGGVVCLHRYDGHWALRWSIPPTLVQ